MYASLSRLSFFSLYVWRFSVANEYPPVDGLCVSFCSPKEEGLRMCGGPRRAGNGLSSRQMNFGKAWAGDERGWVCGE